MSAAVGTMRNDLFEIFPELPWFRPERRRRPQTPHAGVEEWRRRALANIERQRAAADRSRKRAEANRRVKPRRPGPTR